MEGRELKQEIQQIVGAIRLSSAVGPSSLSRHLQRRLHFAALPHCGQSRDQRPREIDRETAIGRYETPL
jgi:hypothetical protein